jgi:hypothetical protein
LCAAARRGGNRLPRARPRARSPLCAQVLYMLIIGAATLLALTLMLAMPVLGPPLFVMVIYVWSRRNAGLQLALFLLQLPPGDLVVAVGVKANGKLNVAQGNVPLHADLIALDLDRQVTVARFVRQRCASPHHQPHHQPGHGHRAGHPLAPEAAAHGLPLGRAASCASCWISGAP